MLEKLNVNDFDKFYRLLEESFPPDEHRTYWEHKEMLDNPKYCIYTVLDTENDDIKAFITIWQFDDFAFVEHFAVNPNYRNSGLGSEILHEIMTIFSCLICLEVELPDNETAKRRIEFYIRNGFFENEYPYIQPPISAGRKPIPLKIMTSGSTITQDQFNKIKSILYSEVYNIK